MSLDALAPDQRAVVQLVLQQDRSYDELAGLLGISAEAVRDRARRGLDRLAPAGELGDEDRGDIADYLLGQQTVSGRERTRGLLSSSAPAHAWATAVADQLRDVARTPLPDVPGGEPPATPLTDTARGGEGVAAPGRRGGQEPVRRPYRSELAPTADADGEDTAPEPAVRARPRPRPERARPATGRAEREEGRRRAATAAAAPATAVEQPAEGGTTPGDGAPVLAGDAPRSSRLGGAILLAGLAVVLAAGVIWLISRDDGGSQQASADPTPTATATAEASPTPGFQALGRVPLTAPAGGDAQGEMIVFASESDGSVAFTVQATDVPPTAEGEAYAVWLTGGGANRRLGFAPQVGENGQLGTSGPRQADRDQFADWLSNARRVVVSRETQEGTTAPGEVILQGDVRRRSGSG